MTVKGAKSPSNFMWVFLDINKQDGSLRALSKTSCISRKADVGCSMLTGSVKGMPGKNMSGRITSF